MLLWQHILLLKLDHFKRIGNLYWKPLCWPALASGPTKVFGIYFVHKDYGDCDICIPDELNKQCKGY